MPRYTQLKGVQSILEGGRWYTLQDIRSRLSKMEIYASECSVSARLRDLRKNQYGSRTVQSKPVKGRSIFQYRLLPVAKYIQYLYHSSPTMRRTQIYQDADPIVPRNPTAKSWRQSLGREASHLSLNRYISNTGW